MKRFNLFILFMHALWAAALPVQAAVEPAWDILDKSMSAWNQDGVSERDKAWKVSKSYITATQQKGFVHIEKLGGADGFITPSAYPKTAKNVYTIDIRAKVNDPGIADTETAFEAAQITAAVAGKKMRIYLKHSGEKEGYICYTPEWRHDDDEKIPLSTSQWHTYRLVYDPSDFTYDLYVDDFDTPVSTGIKTHYDGSNSYVRIGADKGHYCNMDVEYVRMGTGDFSARAQLLDVAVSSDSHIVGNERTVTATVTTSMIQDGTPVRLTLLSEDDTPVVEPVELSLADNKASVQYTIPSSLGIGKYALEATVPDGAVDDVVLAPKATDYYIVGPSPMTEGLLPEVSPVGFIIKTEDYLIKSPTDEYIFPVVIDTWKHLDEEGRFANGQKPIDRYYWYHTPHDDPGGMYLYTAPTLDGPWTEQGVRADLEWAKQNGLNTSHISSCHILWNTTYNKYFMYFHGNNNQTNYAASDDLWEWTFGGKVVQYDDFSFSSREASYAKVFEYEVPGYGNKYVMLLMINENNHRTIYWAHSADGIDWKAVRKPLVAPGTGYKKIPGTDVKPNYADNVSGPYLMQVEGRHFVLFHSSAGNISVVEIGEKFDMEVHWGTYMSYKEAVISEDENGNPKAVSRVASPFFIQDDLGTWYMFFEAGSRLGANTAYAKGTPPSTTAIPSQSGGNPFKVYKKDNGNTIVVNPFTQTFDYKLYDIVGRLMKESCLQPGNNSITTPQGIHLLQVATEHGIQTLRF